MPTRDPKATGLPKPETTKFYEDVLGSITEGVMVFDRDLRLVAINRAAEEMALIRQTESAGGVVSEVFGGENSPITELVVKAFETERPHTGFSAELFRPDGVRVPVEASAAPIEDPEGHAAGVVIVLREASRIRELEEEVKKSERL